MSALMPGSPVCRAATRSPSSTCSTMSPAFPTTRRCSPMAGCGPAYAPGAHWHYSNTGYDMLGKIAETCGGKPLDRLLAERIFAPLGMSRSRGAIIGADRMLYAQGYEPADLTVPFVRGAPLAPAAWVDVTFGAGSVASTADDMMPLAAHARRCRAGPRRARPPPGAGARLSPRHCVRERCARHELRQRPDARRRRRPLLSPPHRRDGQLLLVLPRRHGERRRRLRQLDPQRLRRISPAPADAVRGRRADQARWPASRCPAPPPLDAPLANAAALCRPLFGPGRRIRGARRAAR